LRIHEKSTGVQIASKRRTECKEGLNISCIRLEYINFTQLQTGCLTKEEIKDVLEKHSDVFKSKGLGKPPKLYI